MSELQSEIKEILAEIFDIEEERIGLDTHFQDDLEADSMDALEIIMCLEDKYQITIEKEFLPEMVTLQKVKDLVNQLIEEKTS